MRPVLLAPALLLSATLALGARGEEATLYRDTWGVPHVYAATREGAAYAHGWAQAEDRLVDLLTNYRRATGRAASVLGPEALEGDKLARIARHERVARERYAELQPDTRRFVEAFVAGIRAYMEQHPEAVPAWAEPPAPHEVVALMRSFAWVWPWGQARHDYARAAPSAADDGRGSNTWAVGSSRSTAGGPLLLIDPHLAWEPQNRFYEAHVHGGDLDFFGFSILGTPIMALGHTDVLAFALTTGGPDCADVYEERIDPEDPLRYEYDGTWRAVEVEKTQIEVKTADGTRLEPLSIERTHHGPIIARDGARAFAARTAYDREIGILEQWLHMALARNLAEFRAALAESHALPQNLMYADTAGHLYYLRAGRVPQRPAGYEWDRPVPGWTSKSEWLGIHALEDLVQIVDPGAGFMQNCNVAPAMMMPGSPLRAENYPDVIYNERNDRTNSRGRRALELLTAAERLSIEGAMRIAMDTHVESARRFQQALERALGPKAARSKPLDRAAKLVLSWDGTVRAEGREAVLVDAWMTRCEAKDSGVPASRIADGEALSEVEGRALVTALEAAAAELEARYGRIDVAWGETHRVRRGAGSWPVAGWRAHDVSTLRSIRYAAPEPDGVSYATGGQICPSLVVLRPERVSSFSLTPFGQSDDPRSPHYSDQARRLLGPGRFKPTWYGKAELLKHVESRKTLILPE